MRPRISMITLGVDDLDRSISFYEKELGLPRMKSDADDVAFFELTGTWLGLYPGNNLAGDAGLSPEGNGFSGFALSHNVTSKEEVDAVVSEARKAGASILKAPQDVFWGGYAGYFADPDGHLWEVAWNPHFWPGPKDD